MGRVARALGLAPAATAERQAVEGPAAAEGPTTAASAAEEMAAAIEGPVAREEGP